MEDTCTLRELRGAIETQLSVPEADQTLSLRQELLLSKGDLSEFDDLKPGRKNDGKKLKALGISLAIDDFGTGYSSLSYLHMFPLDTLKIDRAFVNSMDETENSRRIVHSIVGLAHALGMNIVAEGIENEAQQAKLQELGCHFGQGYLFAKPQSAADALDLINSGKSWQI